MKAILYLLFVVAPVGSLCAQGQLNWQNKFTFLGNRAPVYGPEPTDPFTSLQGNDPILGLPPGTQTYSGALVAGTGYTLAIFTQVGNTFVEIGRAPFLTGAAAGYCTQRTATDPYHPGGSIVTAVLRAWDNHGGTITNWDQALAAPATALGESLPFTAGPLSTAPNTPPYTTNISSFNLYYLRGAFIRTQPQDVIVPAGASAQMHVDVFSGVGPPSFQWQRDGVDLPGATNSTLGFTNTQYTDGAGYRAIAALSSFSLTSRVARLSVQPMIAGIEHLYLSEWGADAFRLSYDSMPMRPVRVEVRSTLRDTWINMGQFVNPNVRSYFFDIGPTNDMRLYRLSIDP